MTRNADLAPLLKALKLSPMLDTLPERIALARRDQLDYAPFLEIILADEVSRRGFAPQVAAESEVGRLH